MSKIFTSTLHPLHIFNFPGMRGQEKPPRFSPSIPFAKATWKELVHGDCSESLYFAQSNAPSAFVWRFTSHEPSWVSFNHMNSLTTETPMDLPGKIQAYFLSSSCKDQPFMLISLISMMDANRLQCAT